MVKLISLRQDWLKKTINRCHILIFLMFFASVTRFDTICMIISLTTHKRWKIHQMDVKLVFLNGVLEEEVFIEQALGLLKKYKRNKFSNLKRHWMG